MKLTIKEAIVIGKKILKAWPFPPLPKNCWYCPKASELLGLKRKGLFDEKISDIDLETF